MKISEPFGKNILIEPMIESEVAVSETPSLCAYGKVIMVGDDVKYVKEGNIIAFTVWGLNDVTIEGTKHYLVPEDDKFIMGYVG